MMTEQEIITFVREHEKTFLTLVEAGIFQIKNGSVILNFDNDGTLRQVRTEMIIFKF